MASSNEFINALTSGSWTDIGRDTHITYYMSNEYGVGWSNDRIAQFEKAFQAYSSICNITFEAVSNANDADIVEYCVTGDQFKAALPVSLLGTYYPGWAGYQFSPDDLTGSEPAVGYYDTNQFGSWLVFHELGHGLGLEHPHSNWHSSGLFPGVSVNTSLDLGDFNLNTTLCTVMSYNIPPILKDAEYDGPIALDIAALQWLYGKNMATAAGNDVYVVGRDEVRSIWDAGGIDWLVAGSNANTNIDLRMASLLDRPSCGGFFSKAADHAGGFTIANGVQIENAQGGRGNDVIVGNDTTNALYGMAGNDWIHGVAGDDLICGGFGRDKLIGGAGSDTFLYWSLGNSTIRAPDLIKDFAHGVDRIDISLIDANRKVSGDQSFVWLEANGAAFTGHAGELRWFNQGVNTAIEGDVNGDKRADFHIDLLGHPTLSAYDFIL